MKRILSYQSVGPEGESVSLGHRVFYNVVLPVLLVGLLGVIIILA